MKGQIIKEELSSFKENEKFTAVYKVVVNCDGVTESVMYLRGSFAKDQQDAVKNMIVKSKWKAGIKEKRDVSSTVFITVNVENKAVEVITQ